MSDGGEVVELLISKDAVSILRSMIGHAVKFSVFDGYVPARCWTAEIPLELICTGVGVEHWSPRKDRRRRQRDEIAFAYVSGRAPKSGALRDAMLRRLVVYPRLPIGLRAMAYCERRNERGTFLNGRFGVGLGPGGGTLERVEIFDLDASPDEEEGGPAVHADEGIRFSFSNGYRLNLTIGVIGGSHVILTPGNAEDETFRGRRPRLTLS